MAPIPLILGSGRSGTTWVQDVLASTNGYRTAFEPLHPVAVKQMRPYTGRYLRGDARCDNLKSFLENVFSGRTRNLWINYRVRSDRLAMSTQTLQSPRKAYEWYRRLRKLSRHHRLYRRDKGKPVLTKFIRANLMLDWLLVNFDVRILAVIRHPGAVIESKLRLGGEDWDPTATIDHYLQQAELVDDHLSCLGGMDIGALGPAGQHALIWCIENVPLLALIHSQSSRVRVSFYEKLLTDADMEWSRICHHLGLAIVPPAQSRQIASQQARPERASATYTADELDRWRVHFSTADVEEVQTVLDTFGITAYRMDSGAPVSLAT